MDITREYLEQHKADLGRRLAQLQQQRAQIQAQLNGAEGALLNCDHLLKRLAEPEPKPTEETNPVPGQVIDLATKGRRPSRPRKT